MAFKPLNLPPHVQEKLRQAHEAEVERRAVFANLSNADLIATAKFWMGYCQAPRRNPPGDPVYDSTFWHDILPELLKRIPKDK